MDKRYFVLAIIFILVSINSSFAVEFPNTFSNSKEANYKELLAIMNLDVISYYDLSSQYDTELKIKSYKKTEEYNEKLSELKRIKAEQADIYHFYVFDKFGDYEVKSHGFYLDLGTNMYSGDFVRAPTTVNNFLIKGVKIKGEKILQNEYTGLVRDYLLLKTTEDEGLKIENNKTDVKIYIFFKLDRVVKTQSDWLSIFSRKARKGPFALISTRDVRVLAININNNEIYLNKAIRSGK